MSRHSILGLSLRFLRTLLSVSGLPRGWDKLGVKSGARRPASGRSSGRLEAHTERRLLHDGRIVSLKHAARHGIAIIDPERVNTDLLAFIKGEMKS